MIGSVQGYNGNIRTAGVAGIGQLGGVDGHAGSRSEASRRPDARRANRPTDATGLSFSAAALSAALAAQEAEQQARASELAYTQAGARSRARAYDGQQGEQSDAQPAALFGTGAQGGGSGFVLQGDDPSGLVPVQPGEVVRMVGTTQVAAGSGTNLWAMRAASSEAGGTQQVRGERAASRGPLEAMDTPAPAGVEARTAERSLMGGVESGQPQNSSDAQSDAHNKAGEDEAGAEKKNLAGERLTPEEQEEVQQLKQRDAEVRRHEQAHVAAGAGLTQGGASYSYTQGPDGRRYASSGEVQIDTSEAENPSATIAKAQKIRSAAMAPASPSGQDQQVAASAAQMETAARMEMASGARAEEGAPARAGEPAARTRRGGMPSAAEVSRIYDRMAGERGVALWGSGISFAV